MIEAVHNLSHKPDWETPISDMNWIIQTTKITPKIDACATSTNTKCKKYITIGEDLFKTELTEDFFCNPPYTRGEVGRFVEYCHNQSFKNKVDGICLLFANTCSSKYWAKHIGNTPSEMMENNVELFFPPHRVRFEVDGKPTGTPAFASVVVVWRNKK